MRIRPQMLVLLLVFTIVGFAKESPVGYPDPEIVELSTVDRDSLLAAPHTVLVEPTSTQLRRAIRIGIVENITVEKYTTEIAGEAAEDIGRDTIAEYYGMIRYRPVVLSDTRLYRPVVRCWSSDKEINWDRCEDESWVRLQADFMEKPILFNGDLSDQHVSAIYDLVDGAALVSTTDGQLVTSDKIYRIIKYPHAGNRVNVYVATATKFTDVIYLAQTDNSEGRTEFEISEFRCGLE